MPDGKPAGVRCIQLTADNRCQLFGHPDRPAVCQSLRPTQEMCQETDALALAYLAWLEEITSSRPHPVLKVSGQVAPGEGQ